MICSSRFSMMNTGCFKSGYKCCRCSLKTFGFLYGWLGVIWRTVATMFLSVILSRTTHYDPNIYDVVLITALSYIQLSLVTNLFFLIGIQKEKPYFMLPFVAIGGMEIFFGIVIFIIITIIFSGTRLSPLLNVFIPVALSIACIYLYFWIRSIQLYRQLEVDISRKKEENARIADIRQSLAH